MRLARQTDHIFRLIMMVRLFSFYEIPLRLAIN